MERAEKGGATLAGLRAQPRHVSRRAAIVGGLVASLAVVVGFSISLLGGGGDSEDTAAAATPQQSFYAIAQGITRFDDTDLQLMKSTGIGLERFVLDWALVEPEKGGSIIWPDDQIGDLASHGIRTVPFVWGTPHWLAETTNEAPVNSPEQEQAWRDFLEAVVARYGPGGTYWTDEYRKKYGADAKPQPIRAWQIWNEPNLKKFFVPGQDLDESVQKYARLLEISNDAIKSQDPEAQIVLAGLPGYGDVTAWDFLDRMYALPGVKQDFDAAALHPYSPGVDGLRAQIEQVRETMTNNGDEETPLWFTELGWGSGPPDRFRLNKGPAGQAQLLDESFKLIKSHRDAWNVQRVFWFDWRDPPPGGKGGGCSFCVSAGLLSSNHHPKPAFLVFKRFVDSL
jgi:hypothetical protein